MKTITLQGIVPSILASSLLLAFAPPASATDVIYSSGFYNPGVTAPEPLLSGTVLQINSGGNKFFNAVTMTNQSGTVNWNADTLFMQNGAVINNQSLWDAKNDNSLVNNGGPLSSFSNSGTFRKSAGAGTTSIGSIAFSNSGTIDAQTGTVNFGGGSATFNAGSSFTGAGSVLVSNNASFNGAFTSANLTLSNGTAIGTGAQINGAMNFSGGFMQGDWEVASGQQLSMVSGGNKFLNVATLTNNGTVRGLTGDALFFQNGSSFINNGLHDLQQSSSLVNNGGPLSSYTNNATATLQMALGQTVNIGSIAFTNNGGMLTANGTLNFSGGNATFNGGTFNGSGQNVVGNNASFNGSFSSSNLLLTNGSFTGTAAVLNGSADFTGGFLVGDWTVASGQTLRGQDGGNKFLNSASLVNQGTVLWNTGNALFMQNGSSFDNQGLFDIQGSASLVNNGGPLSSFTNSGTLHLASGQASSVGSIAFVNNGGHITSDGALNFSGGNVRFNDGTVFGGSGTIVITNNATFVDSFSASNLTLSNGSFTGGDGSAGSMAILNGNVQFSGGFLTGNWKVASGQSVTGIDGGNKFLNVAQVNNMGSWLWQTGNTLFMQNGSTFDNNGLFEMQAGASIVNNGGPLSSFNNNGIFRVDAGQNSAIGSIAFVNNGGATINVLGGASLNLNGGNATFNNNSQSTGSGVLMVTNNASFNGNFTTTNLSLRGGTVTGTAAVLHGTAEWSGGFMQGDWTVAAGGTFNGVDGGNKFLNSGTLTNKGTLNWQSGNTLFFQNSAAVSNQGTMNLQSDASFLYNGGPVGSFVNTGLIAKTAGSGTSTIGNNLGFDNQGVVDVRTGSIRLPDNFTNNGTLMGNGAFATNLLTNAGHVAPGASPGTLTINGNYAQTTGGSFDVDLSTLLNSDLLLVNGTATLNGTLNLNCYAACHFSVGDEIVIMDATGQLSGTFNNTLNLHGFASGAFSVVYDQNQDRVLLEVTQAVTAAVPEPSTYLMLAGGLLVLLIRRRTQAATGSAA